MFSEKFAAMRRSRSAIPVYEEAQNVQVTDQRNRSFFISSTRRPKDRS
jgi:hypothetical protein